MSQYGISANIMVAEIIYLSKVAFSYHFMQPKVIYMFVDGGIQFILVWQDYPVIAVIRLLLIAMVD